MPRLSKKQQAARKRERKKSAVRKLKRQFGEKYHPEIHDPVWGSAI